MMTLVKHCLGILVTISIFLHITTGVLADDSVWGHILKESREFSLEEIRELYGEKFATFSEDDVTMSIDELRKSLGFSEKIEKVMAMIEVDDDKKDKIDLLATQLFDDMCKASYVKMDDDRDGILSKKEYLDHHMQWISRFDLDKNDRISSIELQKSTSGNADTADVLIQSIQEMAASLD